MNGKTNHEVTGRYTPGLGRPLLTPAYDLVVTMLGFGASFQRQVAEAATPTAGQSVLDMGCGTGTLLRQLAAREPAARYTGIDPDPAMIEKARTRLPYSVDLRVGDARELPFPDGAFDIVMSTLVFHHMTDAVKAAAAAEAHRVLLPGGQLLLVDFGSPPSRLSAILLNLGSLIDGKANMRANLTGSLPTALHDAGFSDVKEIRPPYRAARFYRCHRPFDQQASLWDCLL